MMTREKIASVLTKVPELTDFGIGLYERGRGLSKEEYKLEFSRQQKELLDSTDAFERTCVWLSKIEKIKTINKRRSSYSLKHIAEEEIGYITNGVFIAAAIYSGFNYKIEYNYPNVYFGMSEKSIKKYWYRNGLHRLQLSR
jgi:hypothetical protein